MTDEEKDRIVDAAMMFTTKSRELLCMPGPAPSSLLAFMAWAAELSKVKSAALAAETVLYNAVYAAFPNLQAFNVEVKRPSREEEMIEQLRDVFGDDCDDWQTLLARVVILRDAYREVPKP